MLNWITLEEFMLKVQKDSSGCWLWIGPQMDSGYGRVNKNRKREQAHRVSYFLHKGVNPKGFVICHKCDRPRYVNPDHLFIGSQSHNVKDSRRKKRAKWYATS